MLNLYFGTVTCSQCTRKAIAGGRLCATWLSAIADLHFAETHFMKYRTLTLSCCCVRLGKRWDDVNNNILRLKICQNMEHVEYREVTAVVRWGGGWSWKGWWWWQFLGYSWVHWSCCRRRWWCCSGGARLPASTSGWKRPRGINTARSNPPPEFLWKRNRGLKSSPPVGGRGRQCQFHPRRIIIRSTYQPENNFKPGSQGEELSYLGGCQQSS